MTDPVAEEVRRFSGGNTGLHADGVADVHSIRHAVERGNLRVPHSGAKLRQTDGLSSARSCGSIVPNCSMPVCRPPSPTIIGSRCAMIGCGGPALKAGKATGCQTIAQMRRFLLAGLVVTGYLNRPRVSAA